MARPLPHLILALLVCLPTLSSAAFEADPIAAAVSQAEQTFRADLATEKQDLARQIKSIMERAIQQAVDAGDLDELEVLQTQLKAYEADGTYPDAPATRSHILRYQKNIVRLGDDLVNAYENATRRYTQARDIDNARLMKEKINWTRPTAELDTVSRSGKLYLLVKEKKTWAEAKAACEALGGYLVCLNNKSEHRFVFEKLTKSKNIAAWIGASDIETEGKWKWLDGTDDYWAWARKEPNNGGRRRNQDVAKMHPNGLMDDVGNTQNAEISGYICEWDYAPTRETIYQTEASAKREAEAIEVLQSATLKHNEQIVGERERLQASILTAEDETKIADAKAGYNARVALIKRGYIQELQGGLVKAIAEERLAMAGSIKTQILRVERQLARLSQEDTKPNVPALDEGGVETTPDQPPTEDPDNTSPDPDPTVDPVDDADDTGTFFGLPLE
jgi:hypothetical protein